ncbi:tetratricopeptide repeat protein [Amycolatopsis tolypomycina]|uniref:tetratricopeptide repeat protein n=1 Tax=Amycolatopsis tolypomycina TaxID=208445 RepID=UPI000B824FC0|nr:tetratricopeptide repeat protein [Amycolatopsis tolypomycina]
MTSTGEPRPVHNTVPGSAGTVVQAGSIAGDVHLHAAPAPELPVPRQLPVLPDGFAGRCAQLGELDRLLAGDRAEAVVISAIDGAAGIGKTTLALRWSHQATERFPDGQLYVNLRGFEPVAAPMTATEALRGFLAALRVPADAIPTDEEAQSALYRSILAGRRVLVLLDNARDAAQVRPLLPGSPTCAVIVTSRNRLAGLVARDGAHLVNLDVLPHAEARSLLAHRLGTARVAAEPDAIGSLIRSCAGFPLALAIAAARAALNPGLPMRDLADELADEDGRLTALDAGDPHSDLESVFSWSYRSLTPGAASLFRRLGSQPGPDVGFEAACVLAEASAPETRKLLGELSLANLVDQYVPGRYRLHDLLRLYAKGQANAEDAEAGRRVLTWYRERVTSATSWLDSSLAADRYFRRCSDAMRWLDLERGNLVAAVVDGDEPELACLLAPYFRHRRNIDDWQRTLTAALATTDRVRHVKLRVQLHLAQAEAHAGDDLDSSRLEHLVRDLEPPDQVAAWRTLAEAHLAGGRLTLGRKAAETALGIQRELSDIRSEACTIVLLAEIQSYQLLFDEIAGNLEQALALWQRLGDSWFEADTLVRRANADRNRSHVAEAISCLDQALVIYGEFEDSISTAKTTSLRGSVFLQFGAATMAHRAQLTAHRTLADAEAAHEEFAVLDELLEAAREAGEFAACEEYLARRSMVARTLGDPKLAAYASISRGEFHSFRGKHEEAVRILDEQRERSRGERLEVESRALEALGTAHAGQGRFHYAADCLEESAKLTENHSDLRRSALWRLVMIFQDCGRYADALACARRLLDLYRQQGDAGSSCWALKYMSDAQVGLGRYHDALQELELSFTIRREMGKDSYRNGWILVFVADAQRSTGRFDDAITSLERALHLREQAGTRFGADQISGMLASIHVSRREFAKAHPLLERLLGSPYAFPDPAWETLTGLAASYAGQYRFVEAQQCCDRALAIVTELGNRPQILLVRRTAAEAKVAEGRADEALTLLQADLDQATDIGDFTTAGQVRGQVAAILTGLRRFTQAEVDARQGFAVACSVDSDLDRIRFLRLLGDIDHKRGRYEEAMWSYSAAATICDRNGDPQRSDILAALGKTHARAGRFRQAVAAGRTRLELELAAGDQRAVALAVAGLARAHAGLGDRAKALELLDEGAARSGALEDPWYAASNFGECAELAAELGDAERAGRAFAAQRDLARQVFDLSGYAESLAKEAGHRRDSGDLGGALELHEQSLRTREELGDPLGIVDQLRRLGAASGELGRHADAVTLLQDSADRARELSDVARLADAERALATVHHRHGHSAAAKRCLEQARARYQQLGDILNEQATVLG